MGKGFLLFLFLVIICSNLTGQTYNFTYTVNSIDTMTGVDTIKKVEVWRNVVTNYYEQRFVKCDGYGAVYYENSKNSFFQFQECKASLIIYDFNKNLIWSSDDSLYKKLTYLAPLKETSISPNLIRYDLAPGIYVIVDKSLPVWLCPDIYITGLKYGVIKVVTQNDIIELKSYKEVTGKPDVIGSVKEMFDKANPSLITQKYPSFPPNREKNVGILQK